MAQRTEKEETEFKVVPEKLSLCVNKSASASSPKVTIHQKFNKLTRSTSSDLKKHEVVKDSDDKPKDYVLPAKREGNRCSGCRRKVGLTGFRCRCGELFCGEHRYSDRHDCSYDYKTVGRDAIARENPVVKAAKMVKI